MMLKYFDNFFYMFYAVILTANLFTRLGEGPLMLVISSAIGTALVLSIAYGLKKLLKKDDSFNPNRIF